MNRRGVLKTLVALCLAPLALVRPSKPRCVASEKPIHWRNYTFEYSDNAKKEFARKHARRVGNCSNCCKLYL